MKKLHKDKAQGLPHDTNDEAVGNVAAIVIRIVPVDLEGNVARVIVALTNGFLDVKSGDGPTRGGDAKEPAEPAIFLTDLTDGGLDAAKSNGPDQGKDDTDQGSLLTADDGGDEEAGGKANKVEGKDDEVEGDGGLGGVEGEDKGEEEHTSGNGGSGDIGDGFGHEVGK